MGLDYAKCRQLLDRCNLDALFIECLGWDRHNASVTVATKSGAVRLRGFAQKRGFAAYLAEPNERGRIPDHETRAAVDREVTKISREHIIIFSDGKSEQAWLWVRRAKGQPTRFRVYGWRKGQLSGTLLERVLPRIAFSLAEEERLTLPDVTSRAGVAFDIEKVTKRFFERFQDEHEAFHGFIKGIKSVADRDWYASVMLNRLMFCYFIQKKGLLDGDHDYLRNRLARLQQNKGKDQFWSFYRHFLLRLFHEGLGQKRSSRERSLDALVGRIPYLNGGLFDVHELERTYPDIHIPDDAFERLFAFFDEFRWHLDERPLQEGNEINPDVLGYIFEKYINQKQMGAYYTKEDITGYIAQSTILPFVLDRAARDCAIAFAPDTTASVWRLLRHDPDAYIYESLRHGVVDDKGEVIPLPKEIEAGTTDVAKRRAWNKAAPAPYGLPTETWREHVARRERCLELRRTLAAGKVTAVNDLVTLNLDIRQFVEDVIDRCEGPELLRAVWRCLVGNLSATPAEQHEPGLSVLDPTCGSGAFLFAALNVLEPLYDACLDRMASFLEDLDRAKAAGDSVDLRKFADFKATLAQVAEHPNKSYYILKSIIVNNLYGVDIMEEACEICKLRLFLKLVAQVDEGVGGIEKIEPLPDIDFNIRAGNTLVGFTRLEAVRASMEGRFDFGSDIARIETQAAEAADTFREFRAMQTRRNVEQRQLAEGKRLVRERLRTLDGELNRYLASEYGVDPDKSSKFAGWRESHMPFHWLVDFYGIMSRGGFDVIIGNPPYIELKEVSDYALRGYRCLAAGNLYAVVIEQCLGLLSAAGRLGMIVPVSSVSTDRYQSLQDLLSSRRLWYSSYDDRPSRLFDGLEHIRLTIHLLAPPGGEPQCSSTRYHKWNVAERESLFARLQYARAAPSLVSGSMPKLSSSIEASILEKLSAQGRCLEEFISGNGTHKIYYSRKIGYFLQVLDFEPEVLDGRGVRRPPSEFKELRFRTKALADVALCCLNSSLFYWFVTVFSDCRHVNRREVDAFPIALDSLAGGPSGRELASLARQLMRDLDAKSERRVMRFKHDELTVQCIIPRSSKPLLDSIDDVLAQHIGFTTDEAEFLVNYDIKYRVGAICEDE
jgi:hypothetical protein